MATPYDKIVDLIRKLDLDDDGIVMNRKIKSIAVDFCDIVTDERKLNESLKYINDKVLTDRDASIKFGLLFASRNFLDLSVDDIRVKYKIIEVLQNNFMNAENLRREDTNVFYNSVALLGEYYHRVRITDGYAINILGTSLLDILIRELQAEEDDGTFKPIDIALAKLILSQVTLNGPLFTSNHKDAMDQLLFYIRLNLIESNRNSAVTKAFLLMTLDLYYSNFTKLPADLEEMYTKYLTGSAKDNSENLNQPEQISVKRESTPPAESSYEFDDDFGANSSPSDIMKVKWSEEVNNVNDSLSGESNLAEPACERHQEDEREEEHSHPPLDENPMNRDSRSNLNYDDDRQSVRSEGGTSRFYDINERLKHIQRPYKDEDWDRRFNSFDRNRNRNRFERNDRHNDRNDRNWGDKSNRGFNNFRRQNNNDFRWREGNNFRRQNDGDNYRDDFSENHDHRQNHRQNGNNRMPRNNDDFSDRDDHRQNPRLQNVNNRLSRNDDYQRDGNQQRPRYNFHNSNNKDRNFPPRDNSYNRSQPRQQSRNFNQYRNNRYGSQNSLTSDSGTWERRGRRNIPPRRLSQESIYSDDRNNMRNRRNDNWKGDDVNEELARNARQTTDYMKYLSEQ